MIALVSEWNVQSKLLELMMGLIKVKEAFKMKTDSTLCIVDIW